MSEEQRWYATGRRKTAVAKVWLTPGTGKITVNGREPAEYFRRKALVVMLDKPFETTSTTGKFDVKARVLGGGLSGQAGALVHGIARALEKADSELRLPLKRQGFLTRDARKKERKKYGQPKARKKFQFSKR